MITRPEHQADDLLQALTFLLSDFSIAHYKHSVSHCPLLSIFPVLPEHSFVQHHFDGVFFMSINAVNYLPKCYWNEWMKNPPHFFSIGSKTAQVLIQTYIQYKAKKNSLSFKNKEKERLQVTTSDEMNSEGLLSLSSLKNISNQHFLIIKGKKGRKHLEKMLHLRKASIKTLSVYERKTPNNDQKQWIEKALLKPNAIWMISSSDALNHLQCMIKWVYKKHYDPIKPDKRYNNLLINQPNTHTYKNIKKIQLIVSSERLNQEAKKYGLNVLALAKNASDYEWVQCVKEILYDKK
jgi:uroporphyrinogen-III synthase